MISQDSIHDARENLVGIINNTPLQFSQTFTNMTGNRIHLKPECLQKNGCFKIRGAYTMLSRMSDEEKKKGVVTCSAGNWAQGVAYAASLLKIKAVIVLPVWANKIKVAATEGYGAEVVTYGNDSQELLEKADELHETEGFVVINPFSNINMITGSATIGVEIIEEKPDTDAIVVPIGGGGLISGIAIGAKGKNPDVKIYGVQALGANAVYRSIQAGKIIELEKVETIADGLAVKKPNEQAVEFIKQYVDEIVLVSDEEIKQAIYLLLERAKLVVEPAGATALAGVLTSRIKDLKDKETVVVLTGGNIDFTLLKSLL